MKTEEFGKMYLQNRDKIVEELTKEKIYDDDLMNETYIDLYEESQKNEIQDFEAAFLCFYTNRYKWKKKQDSCIIHCDNAQLAALEIEDESDLEDREQIGQRVDALMDYVDKTTFPGERKPELNRKVLHMRLDGKTYEEIGAEIGMDANSVLHVEQRMHKIIRKNIQNMPKSVNECHVGHPI